LLQYQNHQPGTQDESADLQPKSEVLFPPEPVRSPRKNGKGRRGGPRLPSDCFRGFFFFLSAPSSKTTRWAYDKCHAYFC